MSEYRIYIRILDICPDTGYMSGYRIYIRILDICPDTGYLAGYQLSGLIPVIWPDTRDLSGYRIYYQILDILLDIGYNAVDIRYQDGYRISVRIRIPDICSYTRYLSGYHAEYTACHTRMLDLITGWIPDVQRPDIRDTLLFGS